MLIGVDAHGDIVNAYEVSPGPVVYGETLADQTGLIVKLVKPFPNGRRPCQLIRLEGATAGVEPPPAAMQRGVGER